MDADGPAVEEFLSCLSSGGARAKSAVGVPALVATEYRWFRPGLFSRTCRNPELRRAISPLPSNPAALDPGTGSPGSGLPRGAQLSHRRTDQANSRTTPRRQRLPHSMSPVPSARVQPREKKERVQRGEIRTPYPCAHCRCVGSHPGLPGRNDVARWSAVGADRRTLVFTDSRDDAAKSGCWRRAANHHSDQLRAMVRSALAERQLPDSGWVAPRLVANQPMEAGDQSTRSGGENRTLPEAVRSRGPEGATFLAPWASLLSP